MYLPLKRGAERRLADLIGFQEDRKIEHIDCESKSDVGVAVNGPGAAGLSLATIKNGRTHNSEIALVFVWKGARANEAVLCLHSNRPEPEPEIGDETAEQNPATFACIAPQSMLD